ncbi:MAG: hypothetical protein GY756_00120 [bacterium]|nr:hypothetical protein [bacterium]
MKNLKNYKKLNRTAQKKISGGQPVPQPNNCKCFCWGNNGAYPHSCFSFCPDGSIPGLIEGDSTCHPGGDEFPK